MIRLHGNDLVKVCRSLKPITSEQIREKIAKLLSEQNLRAGYLKDIYEILLDPSKICRCPKRFKKTLLSESFDRKVEYRCQNCGNPTKALTRFALKWDKEEL